MLSLFKKRWFWITALFVVINIAGLVKISLAYENSYYSNLYDKASQAIQEGNEQDADFYLARYMGVSFLDRESEKSITDLYPLFRSYKVSKPTAFISGRYSKDFIDWFVFSSIAQWGRDDDDDLDFETHSFGLVTSESDDYIATVIGSPYLEGWSILKGEETRTAVLALIDGRQNPNLTIIKHHHGRPKKMFEEKILDVGENSLQYIWHPEFHDLDEDEIPEVWIRYNQALATGFSQVLEIYKIENDERLVLFKRFEGVAEGIARRLPDGRIEVAKSFSETGQGHLGYDQHRFEIFAFEDGEFVKVSERVEPHILWDDAWEKYYFGE